MAEVLQAELKLAIGEFTKGLDDATTAVRAFTARVATELKACADAFNTLNASITKTGATLVAFSAAVASGGTNITKIGTQIGQATFNFNTFDNSVTPSNSNAARPILSSLTSARLTFPNCKRPLWPSKNAPSLFNCDRSKLPFP